MHQIDTPRDVAAEKQSLTDKNVNSGRRANEMDSAN